MAYPQKRQINVAVANKRRHDLSHPHIGTIDFGFMKPIECRYMVPGDEFNINLGSEFRLVSGMPSPTRGNIEVVYRSFFVPIRTVWSSFYDFIKNQQTIFNEQLVNVSEAPFIRLGTFIDYFVGHTFDNYVLAQKVVNPSSESEYDFSRYETTSPDIQYYKFTREGRIINNFLTSLGINIPWATDQRDETSMGFHLHIILPLVSFWKFYYDWIVPSRFIRKHQYYIEKFISSLNDPQNLDCSVDDVFNYLLQVPYSYYLDDLFTTSTEFPFSSEDSMQDDVVIKNPTSAIVVGTERFGNVKVESDNSTSGAFYHGRDGYDKTDFNMYTLQTLGKLQDYLNRGLLVGTKVQDWLLSEFGLRPNDDALHLSSYRGSKRFSLDVSSIISNADTEAQGGVPLGSYGGYINSRSSFDFSFKANEHGYYFITCEIVPTTSYYQGLAAQFDLGDRFDFFQPEFDNQQGMPIPFRRLMFSQRNALDSSNFDKKFGFNLQYADLKVAPAVVSGDFRTRFGLALKSWFLARDVDYIVDVENGINGIDEEFCLVKTKYQDWHYIFSDTGDELDPFICYFYFNSPNCLRPMKSVTEGFEPTYQNGNKEVTLDFSGSVK